MSKGENRICDLLNKNYIKFTREKTFPDLKHGLFRFDFYIPNFKNSPAIIEYNGEQHYQFVKAFYRDRRDWLKQQEHDRRKISYCLANNIPIYIIPYWELGKIKNATDLFQKKYLALTRWKNDEDYENYCGNKKI